MYTVSIARVGISARSMRRKALAMLASMPMSEKVASYGSLWWIWTLKFWRNLETLQEWSSPPG